MSDLFPVAGAKIYIGGVKASQTADFIVSDFSAETWVEIDGWEQCGSFGDTSAVISTDLINRKRTVKQKGVANAGQMQNVFSEISGDAGQAALKAAAATEDNYAFKIVFDDMPSGGSNGTTAYFVALAMNFQRAGGGPNTVRNINSTLEINSNIPETAAA